MNNRRETSFLIVFITNLKNMFVKKCYSCKSSAVNLLKSSNNWKTLHQFCAKCGKDQTKQVLKVKNMRKSCKFKPIARRKPTGRALGVFLLVWAFVAVLSLPFLSSTVTYAAVPEEKIVNKIVNQTPEEIAIEKIKFYAAKYKVSSKEMYAVVNCETAGTFDPTIRSRYLEGTPRHEKSFGLSQIHLRSHPYVSYEQAIDADFSLDFMAKNFAKGKQGMWSCYKILKKQGII